MRLVIDLMQTMNIGGRFKSSTVQNLSACLRGMLVALFAVLSVVTGLCEKQKMTIDGYTFYPVSETEMLGACLEEITDDVIAEARKTGILTIPDFLIEDGEKYYIVDIMARVYYGKGLENVEELILPSECINISEYNFIEMSNLRKSTLEISYVSFIIIIFATCRILRSLLFRIRLMLLMSIFWRMSV